MQVHALQAQAGPAQPRDGGTAADGWEGGDNFDVPEDGEVGAGARSSHRAVEEDEATQGIEVSTLTPRARRLCVPGLRARQMASRGRGRACVTFLR